MADKYIAKSERDSKGDLMADPVIIVGGSAGGGAGGTVTVNGQAADSSGNIEVNAKHITSTDGNVQADIDALKAGIHPASTENQAIVSLRRDLDDLQKRHSAFATTTLADLAKKLDLDLGNVQDAGFLEKLRDAKVAFKSDIPKPSAPVVPVGQTTSVSYQEIHEQDNRMLKLNTDVNFINLQLPSTGREFAVTLPQSKAGTTIILGSMIHPEDSTPDTVQVNAPSGWQIQGGSSFTETNVIERWLYIVSTGTSYLVGKMFSKEESHETLSDVTISDLTGHSVKGNSFILGRGLSIKTDNKGSLYEDSLEDSPEVSVDGIQTDAQLTVDDVIDLAPEVYNQIIGNDGLYVNLGRDEELVVPSTSNYDGATLFFENTIVPSKGFVQIDRNNKAYGIQDALNDDPNISGGQPAILGLIMDFIGIAPEDGSITVMLKDNNTNLPLNDVFGNALQVSKNYKQGDKLGKLHIEDIRMDKGLETFKIVVIPTFKTDSVVVKSSSNLMIQYITDTHQTGEALRSFEVDNSVDLTWLKEYVGKDFFEMSQYLQKDRATSDLTPNDGQLANDGVQFYPATNMKAGVKDGVMTLFNNGVDMAYFNLGKVFNEEETTLLEGAAIDVDTTVKTVGGAAKVYLVGTKLDNPGSKIITGTNNSSPVMEKGWEILNDTGFIPENPSGQFVGKSFNFDVPKGYKKVGALLTPEDTQSPMSISIKDFSVSSTKNSFAWLMNKPKFKDEVMYKFYNGTATFDMNTSNRYAALRYTINSTATKFPVGVTSDADLSNVMAWKDSGYDGEGVIKANEDINISNLSVTFNKTLFFGEKKSKDANEQLTTWFTIGNNPNTPIQGSEDYSMFTPTEDPSKFKIEHTTPVNLKLSKGDELWFWCKSNVDDGLYVQAPTNGVLLEINVKYEDVKKI